MKKVLCNFAYWILCHFEPIDVFAMKIPLKDGTYKVTEVIQNHDFSKVALIAERETKPFSE